MIRLVEVIFHMIFPGVLVFSHGPHKIFKVDCPCCSECWPHTGQALGCPCRGSRPTLRQGQSYCCLADLDRGGPGFYPFHPNFNVIFLESIFMKQDFKCSLHKYGSNKSTLFSEATVSRSFQRWTSFTARILFPKAVSTEGFLPFAGGRFHQVWRTMKPPETMGSNVQKNTISFGCGKSFPVSVTTRIISYEFSDLYTSEWTIRTIEVKEETLKKTSGTGNGVFFFHPAPFRSGNIGHFPLFGLEVYHSGWWTRMIFSKLVELQMDTSPWVSSQDWTMDMSHNSNAVPGPTCPTPPVPNTPVDLPWTRLASATQWKMISVWHGLHRENP